MKKIIYISIVAATLISCSANEKKYDASGTFEATEVNVSSEATGRILSLDIEEGTEVEAGTQIGAIDSVQLYLQKLQLAKNVTSVRSNTPQVGTQIAAIKSEIAKQMTERQRIINLMKGSAATQKQLDDINSAITVLRNQLAAQQSTLQNTVSSINAQSSSINVQIAQIEDKLQKCRISSPISGTILDKYTEAGEMAAIGKPLFKVADMKHLSLRAYVTSGQLASIKLGQSVEVYADYGKQQKKYKGNIAWISSKAEFVPKNIQTADDRENMVYAVKVSVVNDGYIKLGMYGYLNFNK
jgi:HlyD family secretion protein